MGKNIDKNLNWIWTCLLFLIIKPTITNLVLKEIIQFKPLLNLVAHPKYCQFQRFANNKRFFVSNDLTNSILAHYQPTESQAQF
ncbi:38628_t:CDS:2 [Gigaspora margarita]|uniref:38628_t:CDS:1 n=1 Tax=Gigaspora margarita TaxID=4874 RepID=A0ABM8W1G6_GIGMA|nr:38628_t:CDS:2 [Gigaspora margarita]